MTNKFKAKIAENKKIRDYFLDKKYNKISGLKVISKKIKGTISSCWTKGTIKFSLGWFLSSAIFTSIPVLISRHIEITDMAAYKLTYVLCSLIVGAFISAIYSLFKLERKDSFSDAALWLFFPMLSALFNSIYLINGSSVSLILGLIFGTILLFPVTFSVIGFIYQFLMNANALWNKDAKNNIWGNLTVEDHKFISTVLEQKDFVEFLEKIKIYDDLPISDMNRLRKKEKIEQANLTIKDEQEKIKEDKKQKIIDYAESFYRENQ